MLKKSQLKEVSNAIEASLREVYTVYPGIKTVKQKRLITVATEKIKQLSKEWK